MKTKQKLGILGGGQLGKMIIQEATKLDINVSVLDPSSDAASRRLVDHFVCGDLKDFETVYQFGKNCDLITIEIEKVNIEALKKLENEGKKVYPQPEVIELIQNKRLQKEFYVKQGIPTAPFQAISSLAELKEKVTEFPAVQKLERDGYDGRGVQILRSEEDLEKGFEHPSILEQFAPFEKEISVIVARNEDGAVVTYPATEMLFHPEANLVEFLFSPADISSEAEQKAKEIAIDIIQKLDMVGLLAVEMFLLNDGRIWVNEVAPRPHNSGHQSIEGNITSQFEQHLRSILDLPLGSTKTILPSAMVNILGEEGSKGPAHYVGLEEVLGIEGCYVHIYGKAETKPNRKMGHITIVDENIDQLKQKARLVKKTLKAIAWEN